MPKLPNKLPNIEINLLPRDPFLDGMIGKFLTWSLSIGRYIVVLTELLVIISFLSRFTLDRKLTDLNESIENKKAIIVSYQDTEREFLAAQTSIDFLKKTTQANTIIDQMTFLEKNLPIDVKLDTLTIQPNGWNLSASALSAQGMKNTIDKIISTYPQDEVTLGTVKLNAREGTIEFTLNVKANQKVTQSKPIVNSDVVTE